MSRGDVEVRKKIVLNVTATVEDRVGALLLLQKERELSSSVIESLLNDPSSYMRSSLAMMVALNDGRSAYTYLVRLLQDVDDAVCTSAVAALGLVDDSRSLFALANYYDGASYSLRTSIVSSVAKTGDPRARDFLVQVASIDVEMRRSALDALATFQQAEQFLYSFAGPEHLLETAGGKTGQIVVTGKESIEDNTRIVEQSQEGFSYVRPQTYIVLPDGSFVIGGLINEHVHVSRGNPVLAAGEVVFAREGQNYVGRVHYINNRSNGFYPAKECIVHVNKALDNAHIQFSSGQFSEVFPKEGYFTQDFLSQQPLFGYHKKKNAKT